MQEICSFGSVRGGDGNVPTYSAAQVWDTYDHILDACQSAWRFLINDPDRIRSIGTRQWACVTN